MSSALFRVRVTLLSTVIKPLQINPARTALTNHYINKKKRLIKYDRSPKNLEWTQFLKEFEESEESKEPAQPHMIHLITLTKNLKGRPWWEREILRHFGLNSKHPKKNEQVLVKNTLKVNQLLQEVLHLVEVQPFKLPSNLPTNISNTTHLVLRSNGEMVMGNVEALDNSSPHTKSTLHIESISAHSPTDTSTTASSTKKTPPNNDKTPISTIKTTPTFKLFSEFSKWDLSREVVQKDLDRVVQLNKVNMDQFPSHYEYKHNQDGKMHRYNFNKISVEDQ